MSLFEEVRTKEVVRNVRDIEHTRAREERNYEQECEIQAMVQEYSLSRNDAERYVQHEKQSSAFWFWFLALLAGGLFAYYFWVNRWVLDYVRI